MWMKIWLQEANTNDQIDSLSETLQDRCGSFCQPGDVVLYKVGQDAR